MRSRGSINLSSLRMFLLCLLNAAVLNGQPAQEIRSQIEAILESWSDREAGRLAVSERGPEGVKALVSIAVSPEQTHLRRSRAISLLGTFNTSEAVRGLTRITEDRKPLYRCLALQALAELRSEETLEAVISKLDDRAVCMKTVSTDPAREEDVFVSDEAVRALERITGLSFEQECPTHKGHRATQPWKQWWEKRRRSSSNSGGGL
jgi:HEAT repeat protein